MQFAACIVTVAPLRKEAAHRSEMVSQLLLGECVTIEESTKDFYKIKGLYDDYEGWCQKSQLTFVDENFYHQNHSLFTAQPISYATCNGRNIFIVAGSFIGCFQNGKLLIGNTIFQFPEQQNVLDADEDADIMDIMQPYINTPYLWGGKSIFGIDCSGFVQQVYKMLDIALPRDAYQQADLGTEVAFLQEAKIGDLAFFDNEEGKITHVGIMLDNQNIMHSSGKVRIDKMDNMGIINIETNQRTHQLRIIKRVLP